MIIPYETRSRLIPVRAAFCILLAVLALTDARAAGVASSADYSLDYALVGTGAADAESPDNAYRIVGLVAAQGVAGGIASSAAYETRPLIGVDITEVPVAISSFSLE